MKQKILYAHPSSLGSGQRMWKETYSAFLYIFGAYIQYVKEISTGLNIYSTHLPLPPPPPALPHQVSPLPANECPPVFEVLAICSRKPGHQHTRSKKNMDNCPSAATKGELSWPSEPHFNPKYTLWLILHFKILHYYQFYF